MKFDIFDLIFDLIDATVMGIAIALVIILIIAIYYPEMRVEEARIVLIFCPILLMIVWIGHKLIKGKYSFTDKN